MFGGTITLQPRNWVGQLHDHSLNESNYLLRRLKRKHLDGECLTTPEIRITWRLFSRVFVVYYCQKQKSCCSSDSCDSTLIHSTSYLEAKQDWHKNKDTMTWYQHSSTALNLYLIIKKRNSMSSREFQECYLHLVQVAFTFNLEIW